MRPARPHPRSRRHAVTCIPKPPTVFTKLVCNRLGASPPVCCAVRFPCRGGNRVSWLPPGNTRGSWCREPSKPVGRLRSSTPHADILGFVSSPARHVHTHRGRPAFTRHGRKPQRRETQAFLFPTEGWGGDETHTVTSVPNQASRQTRLALYTTLQVQRSCQIVSSIHATT